MEVKNKILRFLNLWLPVLLWALIIFRFSSGRVPQVSPNYWSNFTFMKGAHAFFFGILSLLIYRALLGDEVARKRSAIWAVIITILYGISDEFHQLFTQGREARIRDVFFDAVGGSITIFLVYKYINKLPAKLREILNSIGLQ